MNEWALLKNGQITDVITTVSTRSEIQRQYPDFQVADIYSLPAHVQKQYRYWFDRP